MSSIEQAEHLMRKGAFQKAKDILSKIISEDPSDFRAICDIGIAYTETGENLKAIKALEYYMKNDTPTTYVWEALGCAQFRLGKLSEARKSLEKALEMMPDNPSALRNLGILNGVEGQHQEGLELLQHSMRIAPEDYRTLYALSFAFRDLKNTEAREKILDRLMEMNLSENIRQDLQLTKIRMDIKWE